MAYNTSKGDRELGDIKNENDPDTQIDFENDQISLKTGGANRLTATNTHVSCSVNLSASAFYGSGVNLTNVAAAGSIGNVQYNGGGPLGGSNNLSCDNPNNQLIVNGNVSGSFLRASSGVLSDTATFRMLTSSGGITIPNDSSKLEIGTGGHFYISHNTNTIMAATDGH